jgi:hypothetical protein
LATLVFSWGRIACERFDVPDDADYQAVRQALERAQFSPAHDALAVLPAWSLRPLTVLGDLDPISGDDLEQALLERHRRLFVLLEPDAEQALARLVAARGAPRRERFGRVELLTFTLPTRAAFDLRAHLAEATVRIRGANATLCDEPTPAAALAGVRCRGRPAWQRVTREWLLVTENASDAVWSHPPPAGQQLEIAWRTRLGGRLLLRAGHTRQGADSALAPVQLHVEIDGERVATIERVPRFAFAPAAIDLTRFDGREGQLALVIETDNEASNHFAWDGVLVSDRPADSP